MPVTRRSSQSPMGFSPQASALTEITNNTTTSPVGSPLKPMHSPVAPPPPLTEDDIAIENTEMPTERYGAAKALLRFEHPHSRHIFGAGNLVFVCCALNISFLYAASWALLCTVLYNGVKSIFSEPKPTSVGIPAESIEAVIVPVFIDGLNLACRVYDRVIKCGEPRLALAVAAGAYMMTYGSAYVSGFGLAWIAYCAAFVVPTCRAFGLSPIKKHPMYSQGKAKLEA